MEREVQIREASKIDELSVLEIRNHSDNRIWFFSSSPIALQDHVAWFSERLMNSKFFTLVAINGNELIGIAYLSELKSKQPKVSINIKPGSKSLGVGTKLLKELIARSKSANFKFLSAEVKNTNQASILFFRKNGFVMSNSSENSINQGTTEFVTLCYDLID